MQPRRPLQPLSPAAARPARLFFFSSEPPLLTSPHPQNRQLCSTSTMNSSTKRKRGSEVRSTFPFAQLPTELQKSIIEAAAEDDLPTALNLTLTSRATYGMVVSSLYRKVFISRPSVLKELQATLASRPLLGRWVESLHFGPADSRRVDKFGHRWWPVNHDASEEDPRRPNEYVAHFSASLAGSCDENLIPEWCKDADLQWPLEVYHFPPDCRGRAISDALAAIQETIDIDLGEEPLALSNTNLGSVSFLSTRASSSPTVQSSPAIPAAPDAQSLWIQRMFEAQAALDLYLAEMRRREESSEDYIGSWRAETPDQQGSTSVPTACNYGRCGHYRPLELTGYPTTFQPTSQRQTHIEAPVVLSRSQLLAHMARPGARTDRFDHQLLFLTSGATITDLYSNGRAGGAKQADEAPRIHNSDLESCASGAMVLHNGIDVAVPVTASVASLLGLASSVLSSTPNVKVLSLTGIFERLACGDRLPPRLPALRSLSIGPHPPHWRTPLRLSHPVLRQVRTLRLAGMMLAEKEEQALAELLDHGRLEKLEWVMADHCSQPHSIR